MCDRTFHSGWLLLLVAALLPIHALANNALNLVGYGSESVSMGGANAAIANSPFAVNSNPAGLAQISGQVLDLSATVWGQNLTYTDTLNAHREGHANQGFWGAGGYARHLEGTPVSVGVATFIQGGAGWVYKNMDTAFGTRDEMTSLFAIYKLSPGIGWQINDRWRAGASFGINYASGAQTFYPNTSVAPSPGLPSGFSGINFKDASGVGLSGRIGLQYQPTEDVTLGLVYGTSTNIKMKGGSLRVNYSNFPGVNSVVRYDDAQLRGFRLPQEVTFGIAFKPVPTVTATIEETWYDWSEAIKDVTVLAKSPRSSNPLVPATQALTSSVNFRDQHVFKFGIRYAYDDVTELTFGGNYARRAIPDESMTPTFAPISTLHYMFGVKRQLDSEWSVTGIVEWLPPFKVTYTNATGLWGSNSQQRLQALLLHAAIVRRW